MAPLGRWADVGTCRPRARRLEVPNTYAPLRAACCGSCQLVWFRQEPPAGSFFLYGCPSRSSPLGTRAVASSHPRKTRRNRQATPRYYFSWLSELVGLESPRDVIHVRCEWRAAEAANHSEDTQRGILMLMLETRAKTTSAPSHTPPTFAVYRTRSRSGKRRSARDDLGAAAPPRPSGVSSRSARQRRWFGAVR
jgi:hypothetical protein